MFDWWHLVAQTDLTTLPEEPGFGRSFCHAWSASPLYEFLAEILGIKPAAPGFEEVLIEPEPLSLSWARGRVPTPRGEVYVSWKRARGSFEVTISLPQGTPGVAKLPDGRCERVVSVGKPVVLESFSP